MFILVDTSLDIHDNRNYVRNWRFKKSRVHTKDLAANQAIYLIKDILHDFFKNPHRYYVDDDGMMRKNPYRNLR